jgi:hypothetical protein
MRRKIVCERLTTCNVTSEGDAFRLHLVNKAGHEVALELSFDQAQSIVMTLPMLLTRALRAKSGSETARYVFPLGHWTLEASVDGQCVIATLTTSDGFEASFGIPFSMCQDMGGALECAGRIAMEEADGQDETEPSPIRQLN